MDRHDETWQQRIRDLYENVEELYSHTDITVVIFDRNLVDVSSTDGKPASALAQPLAAIARDVLETGSAQRDIALDQIGRQRAHAFPLRTAESIIGIVCVVDDDGARRELFVRCAMAMFDGYRQNEAALLERERRALEEAQRANRLRDQFMAVIAHELRSPMASILLWENVLRNQEVDANTRTCALDAIRDSAAGQALLVADLLDVSRAINGKLHIDRRLTPIFQVITMAVANARPHATQRRLELVADLDEDLGDVYGDSRRLRQVFDNVLANAIKCTPHGRISVRAHRDAEAITIVVSDTGRGISAELLPHVFEPFRQGQQHEAREGLGLGLAIARQLVELHGGTISASSDGLGSGATFTVTLPRALARAGRPSMAADTIFGVRVLLIDDDARILEALEVLLGRAGAIVATAQSAATAYGILQAGETDVVVSDIAMAGEDGCSLMRRIRGTAAMQSLPGIAITANIMEDDRDRALAAGFDRYLTKPLDVALLISNIAELVR